VAVTFDVAASATGFTSTSTTLSWTHTAGAGATAVLVGLAWGATSFPPTVNGITYGGNTMTLLKTQATNNVSSNGGVLLYGLTGQATGNNTVSFTFNAAASNIAIGNSMTFIGATSIGTAAANFGSSASETVNVTGTTSGNLVAAVEAHGTNGTITWTTGTQRFDDEVSAASGASNLSGGTLAAGGTVTPAVTIPSDTWGMIGVEVQAANITGPPSFSAPPSRVAVLAGFAGRAGAQHSL
jgi:hypothetical protein